MGVRESGFYMPKGAGQVLQGQSVQFQVLGSQGYYPPPLVTYPQQLPIMEASVGEVSVGEVQVQQAQVQPPNLGLPLLALALFSLAVLAGVVLSKEKDY